MISYCIYLFRSGIRREHDHAEPKRVLQHPYIEEYMAFGRFDDIRHNAVYVEQRHSEQNGQRRSQLEAVQTVQVCDSVADELVPELEPLDAVCE